MSDEARKAVESPLLEQQQRIVGKARCRTSSAAWRSCSARRRSASTAAPRGWSGPRCFRPPCHQTRWRSSEKNAPFGRPGQPKEPAAAKPII